MDTHFNMPASSPAHPDATIQIGAFRISVLTERLIRVEFSPDQRFDDRTTQWVLARDFEPVAFEQNEEANWLTVRTQAVEVKVDLSAAYLRASSIRIRLVDHEKDFDLDSVQADNYGGPIRTFDNCDGDVNRMTGQQVELSQGFFSESGIAVLDDSQSLVFLENGLVEPRGIGRDYRDLYILGYGDRYAEAFPEIYKLVGRPAMLPRWALGLWWSRWFKYTDQDLLTIADEFVEHGAPLSMMVVDMDWHLIDNPYHSGWTGYTWNPQYFPEPESFFNKVHDMGIHVCMNLHPAMGVHPHEDAYPAMAEHMGIDPASKEPVAFDITDPKFIDGYFKHLHHTLEDQGVDFWWIDWQQEETTKIEGLDPLWSLNHLHSIDIARRGDKRPITFSRWGGAGSHRYPVGFAGDTYRTWNSLKYGVYYAALCSNLGYGWYSPEIGGFARGRIDHEMHLRWMQHGVFNPIYRIHNCGDPTLDYRPWAMEDPYKRAGIDALKLRRALVPYIYNENRSHAQGGLPLIRPMHFHYDGEESRHWQHQYLFGRDLLVAPVDSARDPELGLARKVLWLPEGDWYDFFTGEHVEGDSFRARYCDAETYPVYVRGGACIPLANTDDDGYELLVFPSESSTGHLYEDDGETMDYAEGRYNEWQFHCQFDGKTLQVRVEQTQAGMPTEAKLGLRLRGFGGEDQLIELDGLKDGLSHTQVIQPAEDNSDDPHARMLKLLQPLAINCHYTRVLCDNAAKVFADPTTLKQYVVDLESQVLRYLVEAIYDAGSHIETLPNGDQSFVWWNRSGRDDFDIAINYREECFWTAKDVVGEAATKGAHLWKPESEFRKCHLRTRYFGIAEDLQTGPERIEFRD